MPPPSDYEIEQLQKLIGKKLIAVRREPVEGIAPCPLLIFEGRVGLLIMRDPEGNGPGFAESVKLKPA